MHAEQAQTRAHHERIRLADKIRLLAGRHLNRRNQRAAARHNAVFGRAGQVRVGADELRALVDEAHRIDDVVIAERLRLTNNDIIRIDIVNRDACGKQRIL